MQLVAVPLLALGLVVGLGSPVSADGRLGDDHGGRGRRLVATMTGTNEVPGPGSDTLTGTAEIVIAPNAKSFCYSIVLNHGAQTTAAHIHLGDAGEAGPVVIPLVAPAPGSTTSAACMSASRAVLRDIERRPDDYYVNVHTQGHPAGALRGQLVPVRDGHHEHGD